MNYHVHDTDDIEFPNPKTWNYADPEDNIFTGRYLEEMNRNESKLKDGERVGLG